MISCILPVDKPVGPTSHDIVGMARRALGTRRIGHTGTLDPFASGLLLLCVEQATRIAEYLSDMPKSYRAVARFDGSSTTDDLTCEITFSTSSEKLSEAAVHAALQQQVGAIAQRPSSYSAKKIGGERAYEIARRGEAVELAPSQVTIHAIRVLRIDLPDVEFEVDCSSGTYVRAIARDVGDQLGTGGYLTALRRTAIGEFNVAAAVPPERIADAERIPVVRAIAHIPQVGIDTDQERAIRFGQSIDVATDSGTVALTRGEQLIAIAFSDGSRIKPKKVFPVE